MSRRILALSLLLLCSVPVFGLSAGDPQLMTDHAWYPGELSCSNFTRLFARQASVYNRETTRTANNDEDKAIASWYWRMYNYYHFTSPEEYIYSDTATDGAAIRDYWDGLFSYGFALCGTTHAQYTAEMEYLLGHAKGRVVGVAGHNSHEAFLTGGSYGAGQWVLLDQDEAGIVFHNQVTPDYLLGIKDIVYSTYNTDPLLRVMFPAATRENTLDNDGAPNVNRGWFISNTYFPNSNDNAASSDLYGTLADLVTLEPLSGYAGVPPIVALNRGETFRRYLKPGLGGTTYVFWSAYGYAGVPGPDCARTWCNQPQGLYRATAHAPYNTTQGEYGNGVYTYTPNFSDTSYQDGVISESGSQVTFYFYSPYAIGAKPPVGDTSTWAVKNAGCSEGLVLTASAAGVGVQVSTNNGTTWSGAQTLNNTLDLTDLVKGHHSYMLRFNAGASSLTGKNITMKTVVMVNDRLIPHLKDSGSVVTYQASGKAVFAAGPNKDQAQAYVTAGAFDAGSPVTMTVPAPNGAKILEVYAAAWVSSSSPPNPAYNYNIEYSTNGGANWYYILQNSKIDLLGYQSYDYWSQSFCYGNKDISVANASSVMVRFSNDGGKGYRKADVYLVYQTTNNQTVDVTFNWNDSIGTGRSDTHTYPAGQTTPDSTWTVATGTSTVTNWVEMKVNAAPPDPDKPIASFTYAPASPVVVNDTVNFTDTSSPPAPHNLTTWAWDFGDGGTSTSNAPSHQYTTAGTYTITLTVTNDAAKTDTTTRSITISAGGTPVTVTFQQGTSGYTGCQDTYIRCLIPTDPDYSGHGYLEDMQCYNIASYITRILVQFDLSSIPVGATVTDAKIELYDWNHAGSGNSEMHELTTGWTEGTTNLTGADWTHYNDTQLWGTAGGDFGVAVLSSASPSATGWVQWTLPVSTAQDWVNNPSTNFGVIIVPTGTTEDRYRTKEYATDTTQRPKITITYLDSTPPDTTAPTLVVNKAAIYGTAADAVSCPAEVVINGTTHCTVTTGSWQTPDLTVASGANNFAIVGADASGNSRTINLVITLP